MTAATATSESNARGSQRRNVPPARRLLTGTGARAFLRGRHVLAELVRTEGAKVVDDLLVARVDFLTLHVQQVFWTLFGEVELELLARGVGGPVFRVGKRHGSLALLEVGELLDVDRVVRVGIWARPQVDHLPNAVLVEAAEEKTDVVDFPRRRLDGYFLAVVAADTIFEGGNSLDVLHAVRFFVNRRLGVTNREPRVELARRFLCVTQPAHRVKAAVHFPADYQKDCGEDDDEQFEGRQPAHLRGLLGGRAGFLVEHVVH